MSIFCPKKIPPPTRVCHLLKNEREKQKLTLAEVARRTQIALPYLQAIEDGDFFKLPKARVYRLAYVRAYADLLNLKSAAIEHCLTADGGLTDIDDAHPQPHLDWWHRHSLTTYLRWATITSVAVVFCAYLFWQLNGILRPPNLAVYSPPDGLIVAQLTITVQGETEPECKLIINGNEAQPTETGYFEVPLDLTTGVNNITITAIKKHGKSATITRTVIVK